MELDVTKFNLLVNWLLKYVYLRSILKMDEDTAEVSAVKTAEINSSTEPESASLKLTPNDSVNEPPCNVIKC